MTEDRGSRDRLAALLRVEEAVRVDPEHALDVLLDEVRGLTGADCAMVAVLEDVDGHLHQSVVASSTGEPPGIALRPGEHWPWDESGCLVLRDEGRDHARDLRALRPDHERSADLGLRGFVSLPVASADGRRVVASMCVLDTEPLDLAEEDLGVLRVLTRVATGPLRERLARTEAEQVAQRAHTATREVLAGVRRAQDELGNGLGVALGRLRLAADPEAHGVAEHVAAAVSRLESLSAAGSPALRDLRSAALDGAVRAPVDLAAAVRRVTPLARPLDAAGARQVETWVLADPQRLDAVLAVVGPHLGGDALPADGFAVVPLHDRAPLTTAVLLDLDASGGRVVDASGRHALAWPSTAPVVAS